MIRQTKIVASLGPATDDPLVLASMFRKGVDVVRINFSHGDPQDHQARVDLVRATAKKVGKTVAILGDLQGPKIRIERFKNSKVILKDDAELMLEIGYSQGKAVRELLEEAGCFGKITIEKDFHNNDRIVIARKNR